MRSDCPSADVRDRLPDLIHERLSAGERTAVLAHVDQCAECQSELALLRELRVVLTAGPRVQVSRIVAALPSPATVVAARSAGSSELGQGGHGRVSRTWMSWRIAASIAVVGLGGASALTYRSLTTPPARTAPMAVKASAAALSSVPRPGQQVEAESSTSATGAAQPAELAMVDGYSGMSNGELRALLSQIDQVQAVTPDQPDPVIVQVSDPGTTGDGSGLY